MDEWKVEDLSEIARQLKAKEAGCIVRMPGHVAKHWLEKLGPEDHGATYDGHHVGPFEDEHFSCDTSRTCLTCGYSYWR